MPPAVFFSFEVLGDRARYRKQPFPETPLVFFLSHAVYSMIHWTLVWSLLQKVSRRVQWVITGPLICLHHLVSYCHSFLLLSKTPAPTQYCEPFDLTRVVCFKVNTKESFQTPDEHPGKVIHYRHLPESLHIIYLTLFCQMHMCTECQYMCIAVYGKMLQIEIESIKTSLAEFEQSTSSRHVPSVDKQMCHWKFYWNYVSK